MSAAPVGPVVVVVERAPQAQQAQARRAALAVLDWLPTSRAQAQRMRVAVEARATPSMEPVGLVAAVQQLPAERARQAPRISVAVAVLLLERPAVTVARASSISAGQRPKQLIKLPKKGNSYAIP
jgi:hypothetical protein